ncbi:uncharacterized protein LOC143302025 [Babylonia areolata]|uniref:uncharacterized protein LOC143302025 n=1 Tax=Babylonia areolata TaxID=304850 RepID=UPI003FD3C494
MADFIQADEGTQGVPPNKGMSKSATELGTAQDDPEENSHVEWVDLEKTPRDGQNNPGENDPDFSTARSSAAGENDPVDASAGPSDPELTRNGTYPAGSGLDRNDPDGSVESWSHDPESSGSECIASEPSKNHPEISFPAQNDPQLTNPGFDDPGPPRAGWNGPNVPLNALEGSGRQNPVGGRGDPGFSSIGWEGGDFSWDAFTRGAQSSVNRPRIPDIPSRGWNDQGRLQFHGGTTPPVIVTRNLGAGSRPRPVIIREGSGRRVLLIGTPGRHVDRPIVTRDIPVSDTERIVPRNATDSSRRPRKKCHMSRTRGFCLFLFICLAVASLTVGLIFRGKAEKSSSDDKIEMERTQEFQASFLFEEPWSSLFEDTQSYQYHSLILRLEKLINKIYSHSSISALFDSSTVIRLSKHQSRSILVTSILKLKIRSPEDTDLQASQLREAFLEGHKQLFNYPDATRIITSSLSVTLVVTTTTASPTDVAFTTTTTVLTGRTSTSTTEKPPVVPCGEVRVMPDLRVVGGSEARRGSFPWMVMLVKDTETEKGFFFCGGSILDRWNIITAGHCMAEEPKRDYWSNLVDTQTNRITVIAGKHESNTSIIYSQEQRIPARNAYIHSNFTQIPFPKNDIAVIRLSWPLDFNSRVAPICLPSSTDPMPPFCTIAGWGSLDWENEDLPKTLRSATLRAYNASECQRTFYSYSFTGYSIFDFTPDGVMCAANSTFGGQDTCQGDSGGPLFCLQRGANGEKHYAQFGLVSWGQGCGNPGEPGFYTFLPHYVSWLHHTALPFLDSHIHSETSDSLCRNFNPLHYYLLYSCRSQFHQLQRDSQCRGIQKAVQCALDALESRHCAEPEVFSTIVYSDSMGLTKQQKRHCEEQRNYQPGAICQNLTAVSSALKVCTNSTDCVSMAEATLCVHSILDPHWKQCTRRDLQDFISTHFHHSVTICEDNTLRTTADGRQFLYVGGDWHVLCGDHWGQHEVKVACTQQGYRTGKPSFIHKTKENVYMAERSSLSAGLQRFVQASGWMNVTCTGNERFLAECDLIPLTTCSSSYLAASICYNTTYKFTLYAPQADTGYGYIKLARDQGEGYVCVPDLSDPAAHQLCRAAGYVGGMTYPRALAPPPSLPSSTVWETEMRCDAGAVDVNGCAHGQWTQLPRGSSSCALAKVYCFSSKARLHNGLLNSTGIVQVYQQAPNGHDVTLNTVCRHGFNDVAARILCRQLGFSGVSHSLAFNPFYRPNTGYVSVECFGDASRLENCVVRPTVCLHPAVVKCASSAQNESALSVQLSPTNNEVRVYVDGQWGTVCADHWTDNEAAAICRQLGYHHGYRRFSDFEANLRRYWPHVLHNLRCAVNASSLKQCSYDRVASDVCQHKRAAVVLCSNTAKPAYTLVNTNYPRSSEGEIHVNYNGTTAPLLAHVSNTTASILCQAAGYVTGEKSNSWSGQSTSQFWWISDLGSCSDVHQCLPQLINCSRSGSSFSCSSPRAYVYCYSSAARLNTGPQKTTGIVQLYRKGQWWEVCHDDITQSAADVICRDIMGSSTASAIVLSDVYRLGTYQTVKASQYCDTADSGITSSDCLVLDLNSTCESFNSDPASVVCYDGTKPSGAIYSWMVDEPSKARVWVKRYGVWGTVCVDTWRDRQSKLLCKQLGYSWGTLNRHPYKHVSATPLWAWAVTCSYYTSSIYDCAVSLTSVDEGSCRYDLDATVDCSRYGY